MKLKILCACVLCLAFMGCPKPITIARQSVEGLDIISKAYRADIIDLNRQGIIGSHVYDESMKICDGADSSVNQARTVLAKIDALTPEAKKDLIQVLNPIAAALNPSNFSWLESIDDAETRGIVAGSIIALRESVRGFQAYLLFSK